MHPILKLPPVRRCLTELVGDERVRPPTRETAMTSRSRFDEAALAGCRLIEAVEPFNGVNLAADGEPLHHFS